MTEPAAEPDTEQSATLLPKHRQLEILSQLDRGGSVRVTQLASHFGVAEETIRRDLEKMAAEELLTRTHGGAVSCRRDRRDLPIGVRKSTNAASKRAIARHALRFIQPDDVIALDASSTTLELAYLLPDVNLTVITNGLDAIRLLSDRPNIRVIAAGGELDTTSACTLGPIAESTFRQFAIDKALLSCKAIDYRRGYSEASTAHAAIKRALLESADTSHLLADSSKLDLRSVAFFGGTTAVDLLVTDAQAKPNAIKRLTETGLSVETAEEADATKQ